MNKSRPNNNTSGYVGITYDSSENKWRARLSIGGKTINIGRFEKIEEAVRARKEAEEEYFGEYSYNNSIQALKENKIL